MKTGITDQSISILMYLKGLKSLYIWETQISDVGLKNLKGALPDIQINDGIAPELKAAFIEKDTVSDSKPLNKTS